MQSCISSTAPTLLFFFKTIFFDFSSAFNSIQPPILKEKLSSMHVGPSLISWIANYLTNRAQFVRIGSSISNTTICTTGVPHGTVLSPILLTMYTADFKHNSELCHMQKFSDDTVAVACIKENEEG